MIKCYGTLPIGRCGVCEALAKNAHRQVKALRDDLKPGKKVVPEMPCCSYAVTNLVSCRSITRLRAAAYEWRAVREMLVTAHLRCSLHAQLSEITILETIEKLTDPVATEGEWITKIDLVSSRPWGPAC